jgi:hypothetical protein
MKENVEKILRDFDMSHLALRGFFILSAVNRNEKPVWILSSPRFLSDQGDCTYDRRSL